MYQKKMQEDIRCPLEYGLEVFGGKMEIQNHLCIGRKEVVEVQ